MPDRTRILRITLKVALSQDAANEVSTGDIPSLVLAALRGHGTALEVRLAEYDQVQVAKGPLGVTCNTETVADRYRTQRHLKTVLALTHIPIISVEYRDEE